MEDKMKFILFCLLFISGCTPYYHINVDSYADSKLSDKKVYWIGSGNPNISNNDLQFRELSNFLDKSLALNGFIKANDGNSAEIVILLSYDISGKTSYVGHNTYGQTGGGTSNFTANSYGTGGHVSTSGTIYTPAQYGVTGSSVVPVRTYDRFILIDVIDAETYKKSQQIVQSWKTIITSTGSSGDIRKVFPIMIAGAQKYFAKNSEGVTRITLTQYSPEVVAIIGNDATQR